MPNHDLDNFGILNIFGIPRPNEPAQGSRVKVSKKLSIWPVLDGCGQSKDVIANVNNLEPGNLSIYPNNSSAPTLSSINSTYLAKTSFWMLPAALPMVPT